MNNNLKKKSSYYGKRVPKHQNTSPTRNVTKDVTITNNGVNNGIINNGVINGNIIVNNVYDSNVYIGTYVDPSMIKNNIDTNIMKDSESRKIEIDIATKRNNYAKELFDSYYDQIKNTEKQKKLDNMRKDATKTDNVKINDNKFPTLKIYDDDTVIHIGSDTKVTDKSKNDTNIHVNSAPTIKSPTEFKRDNLNVHGKSAPVISCKTKSRVKSAPVVSNSKSDSNSGGDNTFLCKAGPNDITRKTRPRSVSGSSGTLNTEYPKPVNDKISGEFNMTNKFESGIILPHKIPKGKDVPFDEQCEMIKKNKIPDRTNKLYEEPTISNGGDETLFLTPTYDYYYKNNLDGKKIRWFLGHYITGNDRVDRGIFGVTHNKVTIINFWIGNMLMKTIKVNDVSHDKERIIKIIALKFQIDAKLIEYVEKITFPDKKIYWYKMKNCDDKFAVEFADNISGCCISKNMTVPFNKDVKEVTNAVIIDVLSERFCEYKNIRFIGKSSNRAKLTEGLKKFCSAKKFMFESAVKVGFVYLGNHVSSDKKIPPFSGKQKVIPIDAKQKFEKFIKSNDDVSARKSKIPSKIINSDSCNSAKKCTIKNESTKESCDEVIKNVGLVVPIGKSFKNIAKILGFPDNEDEYNQDQSLHGVFLDIMPITYYINVYMNDDIEDIRKYIGNCPFIIIYKDSLDDITEEQLDKYGNFNRVFIIITCHANKYSVKIWSRDMKQYPPHVKKDTYYDTVTGNKIKNDENIERLPSQIKLESRYNNIFDNVIDNDLYTFIMTKIYNANIALKEDSKLSDYFLGPRSCHLEELINMCLFKK